MGSALRILQAGELCLDEPLHGIPGDFPPNLQSPIVNARTLAAKKLFSAAIAENAHLVVLAGKLCSPNQETRPYWFLQEQFRRLEEHGIQVVCVESRNDFRWPASIQLPKNVSILTRSDSSKLITIDETQSLALEWSDASSSHQAQLPDASVLRLSETMGRISKIGYRGNNRHAFTQIELTSIQKQSLEDAKPARGTLVEVGREGVTHSSVETEAVRFVNIELPISLEQSEAQIRNELVEQYQEFEKHQQSFRRPAIVSINLDCQDQSTCLSTLELADLLASLQNDAQDRQSGCWPVRLRQLQPASISSSGSIGTPVQIALRELESLELGEVYENLDLQVLEIDQQLLQRLKGKVALRLPELLTESRLNSA